MKITIFFSWQARTQGKYNKFFILECLQQILPILKTSPEFNGINFELLEGITGESGSPQLAAKIMDERIPRSDIFIADLTNINGKIPDYIPEENRDEYKKQIQPTPNPNVLLEYGNAYQILGEEKIISIVNEHYGSLKEYENLLPFDIKHLRFPISYNYSDENKDDKQNLVKKLTKKLKEAIETTSRYHLQTLKSKLRPFKTWTDWNNEFDCSQQFQNNQFISDFINDIQNTVSNSNTSIRIIGLSGLGKSRILLETFRPIDNDQNSLLLSSRILYYDFQEKSTLDLSQYLNSLQENDENRIIILDNCSLEDHRNLLKYINKPNNKLSLITIDSNPEELERNKIAKIKYLEIKKENLDDIVEKIIDNDFSHLSEEHTKKIKDFSQGIPLMATLLSESVQQGNEFIGQLDDKELLDKLLGEKGKLQNERKILQSCSLFNHIGFEDDHRKQIEYIARNKNLTSIDIRDDSVLIDRFLETCHHYIHRQIFERRGRFISMRPFPLAMYLAGEWLETCTSEKMTEIIASIDMIDEHEHKTSLSDSFAKQMRYLNFNPKAIEIVDKLVRHFGPFHDAKVLNTELGSRLFRSFVEVNPIATSNALWSVFGNMPIEQLFNIDEGRRNLIWALEKLCFDNRTFEKSAKTLFLFALAENEKWSNNASGEIAHLFKIQLAGTSANLDQRFRVLEWFCQYSENHQEAKNTFINCMSSALSTNHFGRMIGAEEQGTIKLKDYEPKTYEEIFSYWERILNMLINRINKKTDEQEDYIGVIINSIRSITLYNGFGLLVDYLNIIFNVNDWDCEEGLRELKLVNKFDSLYLTDEDRENLNKLIERLTKNDFNYRFLHGFENFHLDHEDTTFENQVQYFHSLAEEFIKDDYPWEEYLSILYASKPNFTYYFGQKLYHIIKDDEKKVIEFITKSINALEKIKPNERNYTILAGFVSSLKAQEKDYFYKYIINSNIANTALYYFISQDKDGGRYFDYIYFYLENNQESIEELIKHSFREPISHISNDEIIKFLSKISEKHLKGYLLTIEIMFKHTINNRNLSDDIVLFMKSFIYENIQHIKLNDNRISRIIIDFLNRENDCEFANFIHKSIIDSISWNNTYHLDHYMSAIYETLIIKYFDVIWPSLSKYLIGTDDLYVKFYGLKYILGSSIGGHFGRVGVLFKGNLDTIFDWAKENIKVAPERLAMLVPIYDANNNQYNQLHSITLKLINEFGSIKNVLSELNANMGSYSWTGSIVPLLKSQLEIFKSLVDHKYEEVRDWANYKIKQIEKEIILEKNRDEELYL